MLAARATTHGLAPARRAPARARGGPVRYQERPASEAGGGDGVPAPPPGRHATDPGSQEKAAQHAAQRATRVVSGRIHRIEGFVSHPATQAASCSALGTAAAASGAALLAAPALLAGWLFGLPAGGAGAAAAAAARVTGATLLTTAAVAFVLREASARRQLPLPTFRRLAAVATLTGAAGLTVLAQGGSVRTPQLTGFIGGLYGTTLLLCARLYSSSKGGGTPLPGVRATAAGVAALFAPRNVAAAAYAAATVALAVAAVVSHATAPGAASPLWGAADALGAPAVFWARTAGAGLALQAVVAYALKDAEDRGVADAAPFRWLNLGLAAGLAAAAAACAAAAPFVPAGRGVLVAVQAAAAGFVVLRCFADGGGDGAAAAAVEGGSAEQETPAAGEGRDETPAD